MTFATSPDQLYPIGSHVIYTNEHTGEKGIGFITDYNGIHPDSYLQKSYQDALAAFGEDLSEYIPKRFFQSDNPQYNVAFEPVREGYTYNPVPNRIYEVPNDTESGELGFSSCCKHNELEVVSVGGSTNVFPNDYTRILSRSKTLCTPLLFGGGKTHYQYHPWIPASELSYVNYFKKNSEGWETIIRPLPKPRYRYSPSDGSYVPLSISHNTTKLHEGGELPALGLIIEFHVWGDQRRWVGVVVMLTGMVRDDHSEIAVITYNDRGRKMVFLPENINAWREFITMHKLPEQMVQYADLPQHATK